MPVRPIHTIPSGGLAVSIGAMARYLCLHLGGGSIDSKQLLSLAVSGLMQSPQIYVGPSPWTELGECHYGFGFEVLQYRGDKRVSHGGAWMGYCSALVMLPQRRMGVVVLTNGHDHAVYSAIANAVFDRLCGRDEILWLQRLSDIRDKATAEQEERRVTWLQSRHGGTRPSHPLVDYAGHYEHPAYGPICVTVEDKQLRLRGLGIDTTLTHWHYDVFMTAADPSIWMEGWPVMFGYRADGRIDRLLMPLEPSLSEIVFCRERTT